MLIHLQIHQFAIVDYLELEFEAGMSAITGETGAGKSIMIDALGLLLGDRADSSIVRSGAGRAEISASFDLSGLAQARRWLAERSIDSEQECHLRRVISPNGRSRAYINAISQPLQALRELGELLVDIHSQHEHQSLLQRTIQRQLLDNYGGHQTLLNQLTDCYKQWHELQLQLDNLQQAATERDAKIDLLRFQTQELHTLALAEGELAELEQEQRRLANAERLLTACRQTLAVLYGDENYSIHQQLSKLHTELAGLSTVDPQLQTTTELLNGALIQADEAGNELQRYLDTLELDPQRQAWVEQRLSDIHHLARKHRIKAETLPAHLDQLSTELNQLEHSETYREELQQQLQQALTDYQQLAAQLSEQRARAAAALSSEVSAAMQQLGMPGGRLQIELQKQATPNIHGAEGIEFLVSANPGQPLRALSKVASGGELSRISLAIQVIAANSNHTPTLIFDEVDTGIGGAVAEVVGRQLRLLGKDRQVLCVTHLAQVAAQAHAHWRVQKNMDKDKTQTVVTALNQHERAEEIARMLGGVTLTQQTLAHAREMITNAQRG